LGLINGFSSSLWRKKRVTADQSNTTIADIVPLATFKSITYIITIHNVANSKFTTFNLTVLNDGVSIKDALSGKLLSGSINFEINSTTNASNFELEIINNESFDLLVEIASLRLG